jgi:hypothetical protein
MEKYKKKLLVLLFVLPLVAVIASLALVKQTQEVRRKAAYGQINIQLLPDNQEVEIDDQTASVQVKVLPENYLVTGGHFKISFDPSVLEFESLQTHEDFIGFGEVVEEGVLEIVTYLKADQTSPTEVFNLVNLNFNLLDLGSATLRRTGGEASFVGSIGQEGEKDRVLSVETFTESDIVVTEGEPTPTPTEPPTGWPELTFKVRVVGTEYRVDEHEIIVDDIGTRLMDVVVKGNGIVNKYEEVVVEFDEQAIGTGSLELVGVEPGDGYAILIKGPVHLARRYCEDDQTEHCWLGEEDITLNAGGNSFDWTGLRLEPGDIDQNGVVNSADFTTLKQAFMTQGDIPEDINFNGIVNGQDVTFFLGTLSTKYEDEI